MKWRKIAPGRLFSAANPMWRKGSGTTITQDANDFY